jgi:O-antigen/teichoic acid export membrane protein
MSWIFLIRLGDIGMASAVIRFIALCHVRDEQLRIRRYMDTSLALNGGLFTFLAIVGWLVFSYFLPHMIPGGASALNTAESILPLMFVGFVISNLSGLVLGGLAGMHLGYRASMVTIGGSAMQLVIVVSTVPSIGLAGLAWGQIGQHALMLSVGWALFLASLRKEGGHHGGALPRHVSLSTLREMLGFSVKAQVANILNGLFEPISKILIGRFGGLELVGQYELAYKLVALPRQAIVTGVHATTPAMTRLIVHDSQEAQVLYHRSMRNLTIRGGAILSLAFLSTPLASLVWLGTVDTELWIMVAILAIGFFVNMLGVPAYLLGVATGRMRGNIVSSFAATFVMVLTGAMAAYAFGSYGQIGAVALGLATGGLLIMWLNGRLLKAAPLSKS